jgi:hypothetical protein
MQTILKTAEQLRTRLCDHEISITSGDSFASSVKSAPEMHKIHRFENAYRRNLAPLLAGMGLVSSLKIGLSSS